MGHEVETFREQVLQHQLELFFCSARRHGRGDGERIRVGEIDEPGGPQDFIGIRPQAF